MRSWKVDNAETAKYFTEFVMGAVLAGKTITYTIEPEAKPHTEKQFNALHVWIRQVVEVLQASGIDQHVVIEALMTRGLDIPWSEATFKDNVFKPVHKAVTGSETTTKASSTDYNVEYMGLCKWFAERFEVVLPPWPDARAGE
jgi:hypothetical protein